MKRGNLVSKEKALTERLFLWPWYPDIGQHQPRFERIWVKKEQA